MKKIVMVVILGLLTNVIPLSPVMAQEKVQDKDFKHETYSEGNIRLEGITDYFLDTCLGTRIDPDNEEERVGGEWDKILGRYREALPLFAKLLEQRPHDSRMAFWLALAHAGVGEERKAIEVLRTAGIAENDIPERMQEIRSYIGSPR